MRVPWIRSMMREVMMTTCCLPQWLVGRRGRAACLAQVRPVQANTSNLIQLRGFRGWKWGEYVVRSAWLTWPNSMGSFLVPAASCVQAASVHLQSAPDTSRCPQPGAAGLQPPLRVYCCTGGGVLLHSCIAVQS